MNSTKENDLKKDKNLKEKDELSEEELQGVTGGNSQGQDKINSKDGPRRLLA